MKDKLITVASRSKAWTTFARLNTGVVGLNPTWGMDVCVRLFCVCVSYVQAGSGLAAGVQVVLLTILMMKKLKRRPRSNKGP
jgi:hypothetical protein